MGQCQSAPCGTPSGAGPSGKKAAAASTPARAPAELLNLGPEAEAYFAGAGRSFYEHVRAPPASRLVPVRLSPAPLPRGPPRRRGLARPGPSRDADLSAPSSLLRAKRSSHAISSPQPPTTPRDAPKPGSGGAELPATFPSSDGVVLSGILHAARSSESPAPGGPPSGGGGPLSGAGVVMCHPHPYLGGAKTNPLLANLARRLASLGAVCLRFDCRGVGESAGARTWMRDGEVADVLAAADFIGRRPDVRPGRVFVLGYSFGAALALAATERGMPATGPGKIPPPSPPPRSPHPVAGGVIAVAYPFGVKSMLVPGTSVSGALAGTKRSPGSSARSLPKLFVIAGEDRAVCSGGAEAAEAALATARTFGARNVASASVPGADHAFAGKHRALAEECARWLAARMEEEPPPMGADATVAASSSGWSDSAADSDATEYSAASSEYSAHAAYSSEGGVPVPRGGGGGGALAAASSGGVSSSYSDSGSDGAVGGLRRLDAEELRRRVRSDAAIRAANAKHRFGGGGGGALELEQSRARDILRSRRAKLGPPGSTPVASAGGTPWDTPGGGASPRGSEGSRGGGGSVSGDGSSPDATVRGARRFDRRLGGKATWPRGPPPRRSSEEEEESAGDASVVSATGPPPGPSLGLDPWGPDASDAEAADPWAANGAAPLISRGVPGAYSPSIRTPADRSPAGSALGIGPKGSSIGGPDAMDTSRSSRSSGGESPSEDPNAIPEGGPATARRGDEDVFFGRGIERGDRGSGSGSGSNAAPPPPRGGGLPRTNSHRSILKRVSSYGTLSSREGSRHGPDKPAGKPPFDRGTPHDPPPPGAGAALMKIFGGGGGQSGGGDVSSAGRHFRSAAKAVMAANRFVAAGQKRVQWERTTAEGRPIIDAPGRRPVRRSKNFRSAAKAVIAANRFGSFGADDRVPLRGQFDEPTPEEIRDFERHGVPIPKHKQQNDARGEAPPRGGASERYRVGERGPARASSPGPLGAAAASSSAGAKGRRFRAAARAVVAGVRLGHAPERRGRESAKSRAAEMRTAERSRSRSPGGRAAAAGSTSDRSDRSLRGRR